MNNYRILQIPFEWGWEKIHPSDSSFLSSNLEERCFRTKLLAIRWKLQWNGSHTRMIKFTFDWDIQSTTDFFNLEVRQTNNHYILVGINSSPRHIFVICSNSPLVKCIIYLIKRCFVLPSHRATFSSFSSFFFVFSTRSIALFLHSIEQTSSFVWSHIYSPYRPQIYRFKGWNVNLQRKQAHRHLDSVGPLRTLQSHHPTLVCCIKERSALLKPNVILDVGGKYSSHLLLACMW